MKPLKVKPLAGERISQPRSLSSPWMRQPVRGLSLEPLRGLRLPGSCLATWAARENRHRCPFWLVCFKKKRGSTGLDGDSSTFREPHLFCHLGPHGFRPLIPPEEQRLVSQTKSSSALGFGLFTCWFLVMLSDVQKVPQGFSGTVCFLVPAQPVVLLMNLHADERCHLFRELPARRCVATLWCQYFCPTEPQSGNTPRPCNLDPRRIPF